MQGQEAALGYIAPDTGTQRPLDYPDPGTHDAVLCDWYPEGLATVGSRGLVDSVRLVWQIAARNRHTGDRFLVSRRFRKSLHASAHLRLALEQWREARFTEHDIQHVFLDAYMGRPCRLVLSREPWSHGRLWIVVDDVLPWDWACRRHPLTVEGYERRDVRLARAKWRRPRPTAPAEPAAP